MHCLGRLGIVTATYALLVAEAACEQRGSLSEPPQRSAIAAFVTGAAAAALQPNGQFSRQVATSPDGSLMVSEARASTLAVAFVRTFGRSLQPAWEHQRGAPVDLAALTVESRVYFAHSPYGAFPSGFHPAMRKAYGPYYLVTFESGGSPTLEVAVSAYNTDIGINDRGLILLPKFSGMDFMSYGIAAGENGYRPLGPEDAVNLAYTATGARVTTAPELVLPGVKYSPFLAAWRLSLEKDVHAVARGKGVGKMAKSVLVGPKGSERFELPDEVQPTQVSGKARRFDKDGKAGSPSQFVVPVANAYQLGLNPVDLEKR
jgi:hypothetical protein